MDLSKAERVNKRIRNQKAEYKRRKTQKMIPIINIKKVNEKLTEYKTKLHEQPNVSNATIEEAKRLSEEKGIPFTLHPNMCKMLHRNFQLRRTYKTFE